MNPLKNAIEVDVNQCQSINFDFIIIGSGAAGGATALTLGDSKYNILIIEAGPLVLTEHVGSLAIKHNPPILRSFCTSCSYQATWISGNAKSKEQVWSVAGGRTLFWGGHAPRFFEHEFLNWPMNFKDLEEDYKWAEQLLHVEDTFFANDTERSLIERCYSHGIASTASPLAVEFASHKNSVLPDLFYSSISKIISHKKFTNNLNQQGLHLACDVQAKKLLQENGVITGLEVIDQKTGKQLTLFAEKYILSCGALRSATLVIDSGLEISSSQFKKNIGEHLFCKGLIRLHNPLDEPVYIYVPSTSKKTFMFEVQGPFKKNWYDANYATVWLDWKAKNHYLLLYGFGVADVLQDNRIEPANNKSGYQVTYNYTSHDYQTMKQMSHNALQLASGLEGELVDFEFQPPGSSLHERGGLIMSDKPENGVVSPEGKFWDFPNLYCTDTAIWPDQGAANSCLSITAISHHLAKKMTTV